MRIREGGLAVLLAIVATPASANAASSVAIPDGCGDASQNVVNVAGNGVPVDTGRAATYDIDSATLTALPGGGADLALTACAPIPTTADQIGGSWQVGFWVADDCSAGVYLNDDATNGRSGTLYVDCPSALATPVYTVPGAAEVYSRALRTSEWSISGNTVTFHLSAAGAHFPHAGTAWTDPFAHTWDAARVTEDQQGDPRGNGSYLLEANGPGTTDDASATGTLDLG